MKRINNGESFSWNLDGFHDPEPSGEPQLILMEPEESKIGFHLQMFTARALYSDVKITFMVNGSIKIYY